MFHRYVMASACVTTVIVLAAVVVLYVPSSHKQPVSFALFVLIGLWVIRATCVRWRRS